MYDGSDTANCPQLIVNMTNAKRTKPGLTKGVRWDSGNMVNETI